MSSFPQTTLVFLIRNDQVLLGFKKTGFGQGKFLGIGGKVEASESIEAAASREVTEEIKVTDFKLTKVADLQFVFPHQPAWSQEVHVYLTHNWAGEPQETAEIKPHWVKINNLPLTQMWADAQFWLPAILAGHRLAGEFIFDRDLKVSQLKLATATF